MRGTSPSSKALAPAITWMALIKNSVVIRASFLFLPKPKSPRPGMMTTEGLESRSLGESAWPTLRNISCRPPDSRDLAPRCGSSRTVDVLLRRIPVNEHRANSGAQEMIRTTGAERAQFLRPLRSGKGQGVFIIGIVGDHAAIRRHRSAQGGQDLGGDVLAIRQPGQCSTPPNREPFRA